MTSWILQREEGRGLRIHEVKTFGASDSTSDRAWPSVPFAVL